MVVKNSTDLQLTSVGNTITLRSRSAIGSVYRGHGDVLAGTPAKCIIHWRHCGPLPPLWPASRPHHHAFMPIDRCALRPLTRIIRSIRNDTHGPDSRNDMRSWFW